MAVKVLIKRKVPLNKAKEIIPLFRKLRILATEQPGYISGETMRRLDKPDEYLVISTWESSEAWKTWVESAERNAVQEQDRVRNLPLRFCGIGARATLPEDRCTIPVAPAARLPLAHSS
ncbi:MAG: antibiotic biosynthesis monooxygenase [Deltaproteobacteria bacterium]|nr:antibiotic biosynthesis monooxygenase [Deltaproteobacteria bacterium]